MYILANIIYRLGLFAFYDHFERFVNHVDDLYFREMYTYCIFEFIIGILAILSSRKMANPKIRKLGYLGNSVVILCLIIVALSHIFGFIITYSEYINFVPR